MGQVIEDYCRFECKKPCISEDGRKIEGKVIYIDIFGNLTTNIENDFFGRETIRQGAGFKVVIKGGDLTIDRLCSSYEDAGTGMAGAILGSHGYIELFAFQDSLARRFGIKRGDQVEVVFETRRIHDQPVLD